MPDGTVHAVDELTGEVACDRRRKRHRRVDGLRASLPVLAVVALLALFFSRRIPTRQPAASAADAEGVPEDH